MQICKVDSTQGRGALPHKTDVRDYKLVAMVSQYPDSYQLPFLPPVKNQGNVSSCVAHATSQILEYFAQKELGDFIPLSTDFIYGMQGVLFERLDSGMFLRDACKIVKEYGDCAKDTIPTNTEQPKCTKRLEETLTDAIYAEAANFRTASYAFCKGDNAVKHALINYGPVLGSAKWYDDYLIDDNNVIVFDKSSDYGYHAIMVYGWNEHGWLCQNSWGKRWNKNGLFVLPFGDLFEAWSFVDAEGPDVVKPRRNSLFDIIYKIINRIINLVRGLTK